MSEKIILDGYHLNQSEVVERTKWTIIDSHWTNIDRVNLHGKIETSLTPYVGSLSSYYWMLGFEISPCITNCLAENTKNKLKMRRNGNIITCYVSTI